MKILVKCAEKLSPISVLEDTYTPESSLRKFTKFNLLLIKVERKIFYVEVLTGKPRFSGFRSPESLLLLDQKIIKIHL